MVAIDSEWARECRTCGALVPRHSERKHANHHKEIRELWRVVGQINRSGDDRG